MPTSLKSHRPGEIPSIKILRALVPHFCINSFCLIVLVGLVKGQSVLKKARSLFMIHAQERFSDKTARGTQICTKDFSPCLNEQTRR